jgi:hypothetical protein
MSIRQDASLCHGIKDKLGEAVGLWPLVMGHSVYPARLWFAADHIFTPKSKLHTNSDAGSPDKVGDNLSSANDRQGTPTSTLNAAKPEFRFSIGHGYQAPLYDAWARLRARIPIGHNGNAVSTPLLI